MTSEIDWRSIDDPHSPAKENGDQTQHRCLPVRFRYTPPQATIIVEHGGWSPGYEAVPDLNLQRRADLAGCLPKAVTEKAKVLAFAPSRSPTLAVQLSFASDRREIVHSMSLTVNASGPPLIVVLIGSGPIVWEFRQFPAGRLAAVIVYGIAEQAVANLPTGALLRFVTPSGADIRCGGPFGTEQGGAAPQFAAELRSTLGRPVTFIDDWDPASVNLEGGRPVRPRLEPDALALRDIQSSAPLAKDELPPGTPGVMALLGNGALRLATEADVESWLAARARRGLPKRGLGISDTYVATRSFVVPRGLFGPDAIHIIVPTEVAEPTDRDSQNSYFLVADGTCRRGSSQC